MTPRVLRRARRLDHDANVAELWLRQSSGIWRWRAVIDERRLRVDTRNRTSTGDIRPNCGHRETRIHRPRAATGGAVRRPEAQAPRNAVIYLLQLNFLQERCADDIAIVFQDPLAKTLQSVFLAIYQFRPFDS